MKDAKNSASFKVTVVPPPALAISKPSSTSQPQPAAQYQVGFPVQLNDPGHVLAGRPKESASCRTSVGGGRLQPAKAQLSSDGALLLCSWYVPYSTAGKRLWIQGTVKAPGVVAASLGVGETVALPPHITPGGGGGGTTSTPQTTPPPPPTGCPPNCPPPN